MSAGGRTAAPRWMILGARGQLGRSACALAAECRVDAVGYGHRELDLVDAEAVSAALEQQRPDVVLNAAAYTRVDECEERFDEARRVNARGPELLARACKGRALLIQISTEYVFDGRADRPLDEDAPTGPLSAYGRSKLEGEEAVRRSGCEHLVVRTQWLFGPGANFVRSILGQAKRGETLRVVSDQVGRPTWTGALARALFRVAETPLRGTLHLACRGVATWHEFAQEIVREGARRGMVPRVEVEPIESAALARAAARPAHAVLGLARARELGIELPHWREALVSYLDAEQENRDA